MLTTYYLNLKPRIGQNILIRNLGIVILQINFIQMDQRTSHSSSSSFSFSQFSSQGRCSSRDTIFHPSFLKGYLYIYIFRMHQVHNVLYQIKKESFQKSSPLFHPNQEGSDLREELQNLRTKLRSKDTQIIRLHSKIDELKKKLTLVEFNSKKSTQQQEEGKQNEMNAFSQIPMIFENKELKQNNQVLHSENMTLNGKNNQLETNMRQANSDISKLQSKLKELDILQKIREERFKDQLQKLTPVIVEDNKDFTFLKEGILKLASFLRQNVIGIVFEIFLRCAKQCQNSKKVSSFNIFKNYWLDLKASRSMGFLSVAKTYQAIKKLTKMLEQDYAELKDEQYRDTMNQWVVNSLIEIKHTQPKEPQQKLFRLLGLLYRSKFPIKNQKFEMDHDISQHFEDLICKELCHLLVQP